MLFMKELASKFKEVVAKYNLDEPSRAESISVYLTKNAGQSVSAKNFSELMGMDEAVASVFLEFIHVGLRFRESCTDSK